MVREESAASKSERGGVEKMVDCGNRFCSHSFFSFSLSLSPHRVWYSFVTDRIS